MTQSHLDVWTPQQVADLEAWRISLSSQLSKALRPGTIVEFVTWNDSRANQIRRSVNIYDGLTRTKIEVIYPEPIADIVARALEATNEHSDRPSEGTG